MFFVCFHKGCHGQYLGFDFSTFVIGNFLLVHELLQSRLDGAGHFHLGLVVAKNNARVLRPRVVALSIGGGGIVELEKESQQRFQCLIGVVQFNIQIFHVS